MRFKAEKFRKTFISKDASFLCTFFHNSHNSFDEDKFIWEGTNINILELNYLSNFSPNKGESAKVFFKRMYNFYFLANAIYQIGVENNVIDKKMSFNDAFKVPRKGGKGFHLTQFVLAPIFGFNMALCLSREIPTYQKFNMTNDEAIQIISPVLEENRLSFSKRLLSELPPNAKRRTLNISFTEDYPIREIGNLCTRSVSSTSCSDKCEAIITKTKEERLKHLQHQSSKLSCRANVKNAGSVYKLFVTDIKFYTNHSLARSLREQNYIEDELNGIIDQFTVLNLSHQRVLHYSRQRSFSSNDWPIKPDYENLEICYGHIQFHCNPTTKTGYQYVD